MARMIKSTQHPLVKHLVKLRQNRDYRHEHGAVVIEGIKPIAELQRFLKPILLVAYTESLVPEHLRHCELAITTDEVMHKISGMVQPEGLIAVVKIPPENSMEGVRNLLALDNVCEPGNVGALLRTALALGWDGAFLLGNGCDPYNEKALRAARGATFKLPLRRGSWKELADLSQQLALTPYVADIEGRDIAALAGTKAHLLVVSNEAHGISAEAAAFCERITIPLSGRIDSLNVAAAGAILMYSLGCR